MNYTPFDKDELKNDGTLYATYGLYGGAPYSEIEYLHSPVTPIENYNRFFNKQDNYEWVPDSYSDYYDITPEINPDNHAMGYEGGIDAFGVKWDVLENGLPACVRPGNPKLKDISDWRNLQFPEPEKWGFPEDAKKYLEVVDHSRPFRGWVNIGLFERLIDVLEFEGAAESLIEDPEETMEFLEKVTEYNLKLVDYFIDNYECDVIVMSDDWSSERAPFFSPATAREVLFPFLKKIGDHVHEKGKRFMLHSCGNGTAFIPLWIDAGVEAWQFQERAVNIPDALKAAEGKIVLEGYWIVPSGTEEEQKAFMRNIFDSYVDGPNMTVAFCDENYMVSPFIRNTTYELGRKAKR